MLKKNVLIEYIDIHNDDFKLLHFISTIPRFSTNLGLSTWSRVIIPIVIERFIKSKKLLSSIDYNYVLYADSDILFIQDINENNFIFPKYLSFAIQGDSLTRGDKYESKAHINAGVLIMNVTAFKQLNTKIYNYLIEQSKRNPNELYQDQAFLEEFFPQKIKVSLYERVSLYFSHNKIWHHNLIFNDNNPYSETLSKIYEWEPYLGFNPDVSILFLR